MTSYLMRYICLLHTPIAFCSDETDPEDCQSIDTFTEYCGKENSQTMKDELDNDDDAKDIYNESSNDRREIRDEGNL